MWLNEQKISKPAVKQYRTSLLNTCPKYVVIDDLFNTDKLDEIIQLLAQPLHWQTQKHSYSELYVDPTTWHEVGEEERFVQRDCWQPDISSKNECGTNLAQEFLCFLRGSEFMSLLSKIFNVQITDIHVEKPDINTNYFRLGMRDFISQHADDSPGREVCMLLYLNKSWDIKAGGELVFLSKNNKPVTITPLFNRCVFFDPSSEGSEHWVEKLNAEFADGYRYNVTSWYWSE